MVWVWLRHAKILIHIQLEVMTAPISWRMWLISNDLLHFIGLSIPVQTFDFESLSILQYLHFSNHGFELSLKHKSLFESESSHSYHRQIEKLSVPWNRSVQQLKSWNAHECIGKVFVNRVSLLQLLLGIVFDLVHRVVTIFIGWYFYGWGVFLGWLSWVRTKFFRW